MCVFPLEISWITGKESKPERYWKVNFGEKIGELQFVVL